MTILVSDILIRVNLVKHVYSYVSLNSIADISVGYRTWHIPIPMWEHSPVLYSDKCRTNRSIITFNTNHFIKYINTDNVCTFLGGNNLLRVLLKIWLFFFKSQIVETLFHFFWTLCCWYNCDLFWKFQVAFLELILYQPSAFQVN